MVMVLEIPTGFQPERAIPLKAILPPSRTRAAMPWSVTRVSVKTKVPSKVMSSPAMPPNRFRLGPANSSMCRMRLSPSTVVPVSLWKVLSRMKAGLEKDSRASARSLWAAAFRVVPPISRIRMRKPAGLRSSSMATTPPRLSWPPVNSPEEVAPMTRIPSFRKRPRTACRSCFTETNTMASVGRYPSAMAC